MLLGRSGSFEGVAQANVIMPGAGEEDGYGEQADRDGRRGGGPPGPFPGPLPRRGGASQDQLAGAIPGRSSARSTARA